MPSEQHGQWKHDLYDHLDRKLCGCSSCEIGRHPDSHSPAYRGNHHEPSQRILWTCERMHPHDYDLLRSAGSVVMEKYQSSPSGTRCCPDLTILNTHREPMAFIEIVRSNRPTNALQVADELGIPLFTILAPNRRSLRPGLHPSRPWWEFDPSMSEEDKDQMRLMEKVADEVTRRHCGGDSTWANLDMVIDDEGKLQFSSFRNSPSDLSGPTFPRAGDLIPAELCSWGCDTTVEVQAKQRKQNEQNANIATRLSLEQNLARIILDAIGGAGQNVGRFVVPVRGEEVHVQMSLQPLDAHCVPIPSIVLDLQREFAEAVQEVRNRYRRDLPRDDSVG